MVALHAAARGIRLPRTTVNEVTIERNLRLEQTLARLRSINLIGEDDARGRCVHERGADCGVGSREVQGRVDLKLLSPGTLRLRRQWKFGCGLAMGETGDRKFDHDAPQFQAERLGHRGLERLFTVTPLPRPYLVVAISTAFAMSCALSSRPRVLAHARGRRRGRPWRARHPGQQRGPPGSVRPHHQDQPLRGWITKDALPHLGPGSTIINYASTKFAINGFTKVPAQDLAPGPAWTPLQVSDDQPTEKLNGFGDSSWLGRTSQPAEQAPAYVFLASRNRASWSAK